MQDDTISENIFNEISKNMLSQLVIRNKELPETEIIKITTMSGCSAKNNSIMDANSLNKKVQDALSEIRPFLESDGGNIELVSITDDVVKVKLLGNCVNCSVNQMTLKNGVEMTIKKHAPEIKEVINIS